MSQLSRDSQPDAAELSSQLELGRAAYGRRAWDDAYRSLSLADEAGGLAASDLELLARSAALTHRDGVFPKLLERIYLAYIDANEHSRAARHAFWLWMAWIGLGEPGRATGWLGRATRLIENRDCVERGYLLLPVIYERLGSGDFEAAFAAAADAVKIGDRFHEQDLAALGRNLQGQALLRQGRTSQGLSHLDEAMLAAISGELSPIITGIIYCSVIAGCRRIYALERAREWTSALTEWCDAQPQLIAFTGSCLVLRAEIMQLQGDWTAAIEEAGRASERGPTAVDKEVAAAAFYQQAEVHRLRGEFEAAEEAYRRTSEFGGETQPGLALLRLAQEKSGAAAKAIRRAIGVTKEPLQRMRFLPALIEIMISVGDVDEARKARLEIEAIAASHDTPVLAAMAAHARGAVSFAEGDLHAAIAPLRHAVLAWQQFGAPYLVARLRAQIGLAYRALGDEDGAKLELDAAKTVFEELGAKPDLERFELRDRTGARDRTHGLTTREMQVLRQLTAGKTNKAIARELFISEKTVDRHVSNIFLKLEVPSRAAATAYAYKHKLL